MSGWLRVVGLGPGDAHWITPEVQAILSEASDLVGYESYLARLTPGPSQSLHATPNRVELDRAQAALELTAGGARVAVVSGGDPGIFAMASAIMEALEHGPPAWRNLDVGIAPGISAMQAAAARLGAPLGHDFCAISLSDNLKPWSIIERRLRAAVAGDFVIALYNPASRARPAQIGLALELLRATAGGERYVALARGIGRAEEHVQVTSLADVDPAAIDMRTLVLIGSSQTRLFPRGQTGAWLYTPRRYEAAP
ncbi:precorrin-3B C17-methyltransferase [Arboricoccus pini]|uniref:Precorrin-3B C17-methyltransferase n=1 Tax=Arboricoccus pini TaxID=1963835 RepID=A0A212RNK2_9PROT|nr:precorrin-3B C(17)-methyltransferase [Arboricoccus pini]SNB74107.1 precorrin-3B C17-methyltransferase [Arboricoccus pini]